MRFVSLRILAVFVVVALSVTPLSARTPSPPEFSKDSRTVWEEMLPQVRRIPGSLDVAQQAPVPDVGAPADQDVLPDLSGEDQTGDDVSVGEIPAVETVELTADTARKAIDAYVLVREKYKDAALENYENLQEFVERDPRGKDFEGDIKSFGFSNVDDWNIAVTTIGFAYANLLDDQTEDIRLQIEEVKADTEMAQDMRDRMVQALSAMIPSENNRKIVEEMMKDPAHIEKLKQLETEEE